MDANCAFQNELMLNSLNGNPGGGGGGAAEVVKVKLPETAKLPAPSADSTRKLYVVDPERPLIVCVCEVIRLESSGV